MTIPTGPLLYRAYQAHADLLAPMRALADAALASTSLVPEPLRNTPLIRGATAGWTLLSRSGLSHDRPPFGLAHVEEVPADRTPFGTLLRFARARTKPAPRVLLVAPLSGHFSTLLRQTVDTLVEAHDVYLTDWHNARDVSLSAGRFGFADYVDHLVGWLRVLGPGTHLMAVCQPCVPALAAASVLAQAGDPCTPASITLLAGPIDARNNPTLVNQLATGQPITWFEDHFITRVPLRYRGANRRVFPGFVQLPSFMNLELDRHVKAHADLFAALYRGDDRAAQATTDFYDEYFAVLDMTAEFYLETVELVFQRFSLAEGTLEHGGRLVEPAAITRIPLLTIEGERDNICGLGQTRAAHDLCTGLTPRYKQHYVQPGVGHYGVFSGRRWRREIYPRVAANIARGSKR